MLPKTGPDVAGVAQCTQELFGQFFDGVRQGSRSRRRLGVIFHDLILFFWIGVGRVCRVLTILVLAYITLDHL